MSLEAIANRTRIARRYLEALEASEIDALPGGAFDTGYIRSYCDVLGVDAAAFLTAYANERQRSGLGKEETEARQLRALSRLARKPEAFSGVDARALIGRAALLFAGAVVISGTYWILTKKHAPSPPPPLATAPSRAPATAGAEDSSSSDEALLPAAAAGQSSKSIPNARPAPSAALAVADWGVGRGVVERNLVGAARSFAEGSTVVFWTRVVGASSGSVIRHVWRHDGQTIMRSELTIGGPHWRTFSRLVLPEGSSGGWEVEARDPDGNILARERFVCRKPSPESTGEP